MNLPLPLPLPCPLEAGWELVRTIALPRTLADGRPLGGFSAAAYQPMQDRLWLLSDAPVGRFSEALARRRPRIRGEIFLSFLNWISLQKTSISVDLSHS